ncbi:MAG: hypothetical protein KDB26_10140 [Microthrixaceae bacterium]|nr:hypothetical protein [Microthrixaceae bacterium]
MRRLGVSAALVAGQWIKGDVAIETGVVTAIGLSPPVGSAVAVSGFVDHQINGFAGVDFGHTDEAGYARVASRLPETGVTAFHPTLYSLSRERYIDSLGLLAEVHRKRPAGARVLGAHLEGPFLSPPWVGAHDATTFLEPDPEVVTSLISAGPIDVMTVAPELPGALGLIRQLVANGVTVSIGHTDASAEQCREAFDAGASMITHCYNAHRRFTSRDPGPMGAALTDARASIGLIADGIHVADDSLRLAASAAPDRLVLVTDAIAAAGVAPEEWNTLDSRVRVAGGAARLSDGTLAGSVATMDACVRKMISLGVPSEAVLHAAGGNRLRPGAAVDLVFLDDGWRVQEALIV